MEQVMNILCKYAWCALGAVWSAVEPQLHFVLICLFAMLLDCVSAWHLNYRVRKKFGKENTIGLKSSSFARLFISIIKVFSMLVLAGLLQKYVFEDLPIRLANIVAGAVCFWQIWSILENESSCNDAKWAKIAQRILIDKAERHFNVKLDELKDKEEKKPTDNTETDEKNQ